MVIFLSHLARVPLGKRVHYGSPDGRLAITGWLSKAGDNPGLLEFRPDLPPDFIVWHFSIKVNPKPFAECRSWAEWDATHGQLDEGVLYTDSVDVRFAPALVNKELETILAVLGYEPAKG